MKELMNLSNFVLRVETGDEVQSYHSNIIWGNAKILVKFIPF